MENTPEAFRSRVALAAARRNATRFVFCRECDEPLHTGNAGEWQEDGSCILVSDLCNLCVDDARVTA